MLLLWQKNIGIIIQKLYSLYIMKQVKIFSAFDVFTLQYQVNEWLTANRNADVSHTSMSSFGTPDMQGGEGKEKHTFYIVYSNLPSALTEATAILEQALPAVSEMPNMDTDVLPHAN
jgi:hypothetical protein